MLPMRFATGLDGPPGPRVQTKVLRLRRCNSWRTAGGGVVRAKRVKTEWTGQVPMPHASGVVPIEPEASVLARVRKALEIAGGVHVMRNNVGAFKLARGRFFRAGLGKGSSDLVCIVAPYGRWLCIETKRPKKSEMRDGQVEWLQLMRNYGAVAGVCTTPEQALELLKQARRPAFEDDT